MLATRERTPWVTATATTLTRTNSSDPARPVQCHRTDSALGSERYLAALCPLATAVAFRTPTTSARYYGGSLAGLPDSNYVNRRHGTQRRSHCAGMCGWTQGISYYGDDQNTEFDALQVNLAKSFQRALRSTPTTNGPAPWDQQSAIYTWNHYVTHQRDSNTRASILFRTAPTICPSAKASSTRRTSTVSPTDHRRLPAVLCAQLVRAVAVQRELQ